MTLSTSEALRAFVEEYATESDRAAGILVGVGLDGRMEDLLRAHLVAWPKLGERLLGENRPLGSFSARIDVAYALGLLPDTEWRNLHALRKIRNFCAHRPSVSFTDPPIRQLAAGLRSMGAEPGWQPTEGILASVSLPRFQVFLAAFQLFSMLEFFTQRTRQRVVRAPISGASAMLNDKGP
jgi:DNA-binding MltR family transcriptional regulator